MSFSTRSTELQTNLNREKKWSLSIAQFEAFKTKRYRIIEFFSARSIDVLNPSSVQKSRAKVRITLARFERVRYACAYIYLER